jgi:hypothetical protein
LDFTVELDHAKNVASLLGRKIGLEESNVVLVDEVDSQSGPRLVGATRVDPALPRSQNPVVVAVRQQPELVRFLQCDVPLPNPATQRLLTGVCADVRK